MRRDVGVSGFFVDRGRVGGAEQMFYDLVFGLSGTNSTIDLFHSSKQKWDPSFSQEMRGWQNVRSVPTRSSSSRFIDEQALALTSSSNVETMIFPNYFTPFGCRSRSVTVIHDLLFKEFPSFVRPHKRAWLEVNVRGTLARADRIVAISKFTAESLIRHFGDRHAHKIKVVGNPIRWPKEELARPIPGPYVLSVAAEWPHKNLETMYEAFSLVKKKRRDLKFVVIGQKSNSLKGHLETIESRKWIDRLGLSGDVMPLGFIEREKVHAYSSHCDLFVSTSLYEGFGLGPVEALGYGRPTLISDRAALPETTMGFATSVQEALDAEAWAGKMLEILDRPSVFAPTPEQVAAIRGAYDPVKIASEYLA